jgi:hypothetical protein
MINLYNAPSARLFTTWGTILYVDADSGELRHGPIEERNSPVCGVRV